MHRPVSVVVRVALLAALVGMVCAVLADRSPRRSLHGIKPVVGSLDTWPEVPRRPTD